MDQLYIFILGILSVWFSQSDKYHVAKWACVFGLLSQPVWFVVTFEAEQWGMFCLSLFYFIGWMKGLWVFWIRPYIGVQI